MAEEKAIHVYETQFTDAQREGLTVGHAISGGGGKEGGVRVRLEWKPQDLWIGAYWKVSEGPFSDSIPGIHPRDRQLDLWICLLPMLPVHFTWDFPARAEEVTDG